MKKLPILILSALLILGPVEQSAFAWLVQFPASPATSNVATVADNATNASGAPADTITTVTFPWAISIGGTPAATSEPERVIFWNQGTSSLSITNITYTGPFSTGTTNCSGSLGANSYCYDWVIYTPTASGAQTGTATLNYTGGSKAINLKGTGQTGTVVNSTCATLPATLSANTTYVLGAVTCTGQTVTMANGATLQGDCTAPEGINTVFNGNGANGLFTDGLAGGGITNATIRCIAVTKYGADAGCPLTAGGAGNPMINLNTGWLIANSYLHDSCSVAFISHGGSNEVYHSHIYHNAYNGSDQQNTSGTYTDKGNEYDHNSYYTGTGDCTGSFDCGANKASNTGGNATFTFDGLYSHDQVYNSAKDPPGVWCDGIGTQNSPLTPLACGAAFNVTNSTIVNNDGDGIRLEIATSPGTFNHNVITGNGAGGPIVGACTESITLNNNYLDNTGSSNGDAVGGNYEGRCTGSVSHSATFSASNNIVVMRNSSGIQWGMPTGEFSSFSTTSANNKFYTASNAITIASFNTGTSGNEAFSSWKTSVGDSTSTIQTGTPSARPSGCTGDGTYGIGCVGSGI